MDGISFDFEDDNKDDDLFSDNLDDDLFADEGDDSLFSDNESVVSKGESQEGKWKIMIVDDEEDVHNVTRFTLSDYRYKDKELQFLNAYSGIEAKNVLEKHKDIALIFLDVVMESQHAGLELVQHIRNELSNHFVRIILRTGQPGYAPEEEVILKYDINDYKNKTELTDRKLFTSLTTSLRTYADIMELESFRKELEEKVEERTQEIASKNEELSAKNEQIIGSISYAQRIQQAVLPYVESIQEVFPNSFILFRPRDIVSGDFYWFSKKNNHCIISAIDCTGHGVPGAFMSMIGDAYLNQIVNVHGVVSPELILNELHLKIRSALKQDQTNNRDGMDMVICTYNKTDNELSFAGAKNPLVYIKGNEVLQIKGDRKPIGGSMVGEEVFFTKHTLVIDQPTTFYMFSDGFQDQFGGALNMKFMIKNFRNLLFEIHQEDFKQQKEILNIRLDNWIKEGVDKEQTDDILVIGFRLEPSFY